MATTVEQHSDLKDSGAGYRGRLTSAGRHPHPRSRRVSTRLGTIHLVLGMVCVLAVLAATTNLRVGAGLLLSANAMLALMDWQAFVSLGGLLDWKRLSVAAKIGLSLVLLTGCIAPPTIIARALRAAWETRQHKTPGA